MKLPTWNWVEARKQFEMRIPGLVKTRADTIKRLNQLSGSEAYAWHGREKA